MYLEQVEINKCQLISNMLKNYTSKYQYDDV
mgnify:CR=1 FL=1